MKSTPQLSALQTLGLAAPAAGELELLRAALLPPEQAAQAWRRWSQGCTVVTAHWRAHALFPAVGANLSAATLGSDAARLRGLRRRTWAANQLKFAALGTALETLAPLDALPIVAKGAALATSVYNNPGDRSMGDVDLIVGVDQFEQSVELLSDAGWRPGAAFEHQPFVHASALVDAEGHELDLHRWMMFPRHTRVVEMGWLERATRHEIGGRPCRRFTIADELVLAVMHGIGPDSDSAVRWPLDVDRIVADAALHDGTDRLWSAVCRSCWELKIGQPVAVGLRLCAEELALDVPRDVLAELESIPFDRMLQFEQRLLARGRAGSLKTRQYIDTERVAGRRPTLTQYVAMRTDAFRKGGGLGSIAKRRYERTRRRVSDGRNHRRSW